MKNIQSKSLSVEEAQGIATEALLQLSRDPEQIGRFLAFSGIGPEMIREAAGEPGFLAGVLEFYMMDEALLLAFCENAGIRPTMMAAARYAIAGGDEDHA
ncbi:MULTISPECIES: DUF3572 domain-containing protein [Stappiaceae]|jgi:hypothetical protein|uniref:DUF3572 family protein n=1 Tax=Roseibium aggregatum TaxID=187304 RepID=A0A0M6XVK1_9HYPH|nr:MULTISPECIES: DUF3572 domain-containing protein [Stappiaceae]MCR9282382.1 DUF3572 domain-containing protein [Paracoccaceae bacterium]MEC9421677.1 DUF3572 domain-containing protein [Pseudomonadota bacterium]AMN53815.1 hypothetical protein ACP90_16845 [Labrenzia sp. CP4]ERP85777.1 hypothetical protein Q669_18580 [Labrenzia sp. C1B10]ERS07293.1 hypothetical protein Q675_24205 [Labrenzia sp. C1B70]